MRAAVDKELYKNNVLEDFKKQSMRLMVKLNVVFLLQSMSVLCRQRHVQRRGHCLAAAAAALAVPAVASPKRWRPAPATRADDESMEK